MSDSSDPPRPPSAGTPSQAPGAANHHPAHADSLGSNVHILDRLAILYRYRRVSLAVFVLTTIALRIQSNSNIQLFEAKAQLLIEEERSTAMPGITTDKYYEDLITYNNTQYRILRGRDLSRRAAKRLHVETVPEFNGTQKPAATPVTMLRDAAGRLTRLVTRSAFVEQEPPKPDETADESALVSAFLGGVQVAPVANSKLVDVFFTSTDPRLAADAA